MLAPFPAAASTLVLPYLGYDTSTFELAGPTPRGLHRWQKADLQAALAQRVAQEKQRQELAVYYYRINHTLAFPLPLAQRPAQMPPGIPGFPAYPWLTWLSWALEERWRILLAAQQLHDDTKAGQHLQNELAQLAGWSSFVEWNGQPGLALGHIAGVLARALHDPAAWQPDLLAATRRAAEHLLAHDVLPWYQERWAAFTEEAHASLTPAEIHNIPVIALVRSAQLARVLGHSATEILDSSSKAVLRAWCRLRMDPHHPHTEGTAYDGYLMDSLTEWLDALPDKEALLADAEPALTSLTPHWLHTTLPGRVDLHVPISDVEPEMPFWMSVLVRLARWYKHPAARWLAQHLPPDRMPAATLIQLLQPDQESPDPDSGAQNHGSTIPNAAPQRLPNAITLRTGWDSVDTLVAVGASRSTMSHLHDDSGHVVIGWQNRFWLTDPGYQQYRQGEEREFSIGATAHNAPVVGEIRQTQRAARLCHLAREESRQYTCLDLTPCYPDLSPSARIFRHVWLTTAHAGDPAMSSPAFSTVVICDEVYGLPAGTEITTAWQFGTHLAWAFQDGWVRLSDGVHTLWVATITDGDTNGEESAPQSSAWSPAQLQRHAGSRGPLTLHERYTLIHAVAPATHQSAAQPTTKCWKIFQFQPCISWTPPTIDTRRGAPADTTVDVLHIQTSPDIEVQHTANNHTVSNRSDNNHPENNFGEEFSTTQLKTEVPLN